jgi:hypothetical protein
MSSDLTSLALLWRHLGLRGFVLRTAEVLRTHVEASAEAMLAAILAKAEKGLCCQRKNFKKNRLQRGSLYSIVLCDSWALLDRQVSCGRLSLEFDVAMCPAQGPGKRLRIDLSLYRGVR